jgi:hypothetical protein
MEFRPAATIDGRSAIEVWDGPELAATIYAQRGGLHVVTEAPYLPEDFAIELRRRPD